MCLSGCGPVEGSEVYDSPGGAIGLGGNHHARAPGDWVVDGHFLENLQVAVSIQPSLDLFLPMEWDLAGCVYGYRFGLWVCKDP